MQLKDKELEEKMIEIKGAYEDAKELKERVEKRDRELQ